MQYVRPVIVSAFCGLIICGMSEVRLFAQTADNRAPNTSSDTLLDAAQKEEKLGTYLFYT